MEVADQLSIGVSCPNYKTRLISHVQCLKLQNGDIKVFMSVLGHRLSDSLLLLCQQRVDISFDSSFIFYRKPARKPRLFRARMNGSPSEKLPDMVLYLCYNVAMKRKEPKDTSINTRYPPEVLLAIRQFAQEDQRSLNGMIIWILREYIKQRQGK